MTYVFKVYYKDREASVQGTNFTKVIASIEDEFDIIVDTARFEVKSFKGRSMFLFDEKAWNNYIEEIGYTTKDIIVIGEESETAIPIKVSRRSKVCLAIVFLLLAVFGFVIVINL